MGHWSKLRTEPVSLYRAMGNFGYSNHAHQSLYRSTWHDGRAGVLIACGRGRMWGRMLPAAPHVPISAVDTTNHRNGRTSKTYLWARNMDTLPRKLNSQSYPFGKPLTFADGEDVCCPQNWAGLGLQEGAAGGWGCVALTRGRTTPYGTETSSAPWQHPDL